MENAGSTCEVYGSDLKVYVSDTTRLYPDALIACGNIQYDDKDTLRNPLLVMEVLSPSTENYDKSEKRQRYQRIDSLRHYLLTAQYRVEVTHYEKQSDGSWTLAGTYTNLSDHLPLSLPDARIALPLSRIYRRVSFEIEPIS